MPAPAVPPLAWAVIALVLIPTAVFAGADALGGHLLLSGDNLIQSYPLRVLVGSDIAHGVMPTWNPWIWSGTPLMAGLNAGAFYPTTLLFAVLNPHVAWVIGEIFVFSAVSVGTCLLFSESGMSPAAAFLGAAVFAFGGAVLTQASLHMDMAEGLASLPWVLLAIRRIGADGRWRWSVVLGVAFSLTILSGSPEAMLDITLLGLTYAALRCSVQPSTWMRLVSRGAVGGALSAGLTAALWLPALHFIGASERAHVTVGFASGYAFPPAGGVLSVIPYLEGGFGLFSQPAFFGYSNLGELGCYLGILPLIAVATLWTPSWRSWLPAGEQRCWYGVLLVGLVLAVAAGTPLEHLLYKVPLYGKQRDSGRNIVDVDLAASALFAWWVDGGARPVMTRIRRANLAPFAPLAVVVAVGIWFAFWPAGLWTVLGAYPPPPSSGAAVGAAIALAGGLAAVGGAIAWGRGRISRQMWLSAAGVFAMADLALFACGSGYASAQRLPASPKSGPVMRLVKASLAPAGRYAFFDPYLFDSSGLLAAGEPDAGIVNGIKSFSGYGAVVDSTYSSVTATHLRANFDQVALEAGDFDALGLQVLVTVPEEFLEPLAAPPASDGSVEPVAEAPGVDPALPGGSVPAPALLVQPVTLSAAHSAVSIGGQLGWFFGTTLRPASAVLTLDVRSDGQLVRAGLVTPSGSIAWQHPERLGVGTRTAALSLPTTAAVGAVVELLSGAPLGPAKLVVDTTSHSYLVAGPLARAITPATWSEVGDADHFAVFRLRFDPRAAWLQPATIPTRAPRPRLAARVSSTSISGSAAVFSGHYEFGSAQLSASTADSATIGVSAPRAGILTWSTAYDAGWRAELVPAHGRARSVPVERVGLVLGVAVGPGKSTVRFSYRPVGYSKGIAISLATLLAWAIVTIGWLMGRRGRRGAGGPAPAA